MNTLVKIFICILSFFNIRSIFNTSDIKLNESNFDVVREEDNDVIVDNVDDVIMNLYIPKINVRNNIYSKDSIENNIDKNVIIMDESSTPDTLDMVLLGAHSGTGPLAYFKDFDKLEIGDEIYLNYKGINYKYLIKYMYDDFKDGKIKVSKNYKNSLILYTCKPKEKDYFLVVVAQKEI